MSWFSKRLVFIMGKGGTGKTTVTAALALTARNARKRVLAVELDGSHRLAGFFHQERLPERPVPLTDHVDGVCLDPKAALKEYIHAHLPFSMLAGNITRSELFDVIAEAMPGLKEAMTLGQIWRWAEELDENGSYRYDQILVDSPSTGHGVSLLKQPETLIRMLKVGPVVDQLSEVHAFLSDASLTGLVLVTLPEELPTNETLELTRAAKSELKIPVEATVINGLYPRIFAGSEIKHLQVLKERSEDDDIRMVLKTALAQHRRYRFQNFFASHLRKHASGHIIDLPYLFTNDLRMGELQTLARVIAEGQPEIDFGTAEMSII